MPRCKRCGHFGPGVCEVDEEYGESIRQEMQDLVDTREQVAGVIRRVKATRLYQTKELEPVKEEELEYSYVNS